MCLAICFLDMLGKFTNDNGCLWSSTHQKWFTNWTFKPKWWNRGDVPHKHGEKKGFSRTDTGISSRIATFLGNVTIKHGGWTNKILGFNPSVIKHGRQRKIPERYVKILAFKWDDDHNYHVHWLTHGRISVCGRDGKMLQGGYFLMPDPTLLENWLGDFLMPQHG